LLNAVLADGEQKFGVDVCDVLITFETCLGCVDRSYIGVGRLAAIDTDQDEIVVR